MDDQDHAGADYRDVAVVALESGDGRTIGVRNGIEGLAVFHFVVNHRGLHGWLAVDFRGLGGGRFGRGRFGGLGAFRIRA